MNTNWKLDTHGDPLGTLQTFVQALWKQTDLDALVVAPNGHGFVIETPGDLEHMNPFRPVMKTNTAKLVVETAKKLPDHRLGVILRPCEMRALNEMIARGAVKRENLLTVCVDCLGTFPAEEFEWRTERSQKGLTKEALHFAPQGGISAYRYRPACQMCADPGAEDGDINIGVLGLPVRQSMLVNAHNGKAVLETVTNGLAEDELVEQHDHMLAKISEKHGRTRERVLTGLESSLPADLNGLLDQFEACGGCQSCMDVCPLCSVDRPRVEENGRMVREDVINWLVSCAGCGMCEQSCPQHQPLSAIFSHVRETIEAELTL